MNKPRNPPSIPQMQLECDKWNDAHPVGSVVNYWPGVMDESTPPRAGKTSTDARVLGGHTAGVYVEPGGFISLDHVKAVAS
jgi:hypothetical protein